MTARFSRARQKGNKLPPFVALTWELLNSRAYIDLPHSAKGALPYFLGKVKAPFNDSQRCSIEFSFSYGEAERFGFARGTHNRSITELMDKGFLNPVDKGGLRGCGRSFSLFTLSARWKKYGTSDFEQIEPWHKFAPTFRKIKSSPSPNLDAYKSKSGTEITQKASNGSRFGLVEDI